MNINERTAEKLKDSKSVYMFCTFNLDQVDEERTEQELTMSVDYYYYYLVNNLNCGLVELKANRVINIFFTETQTSN